MTATHQAVLKFRPPPSPPPAPRHHQTPGTIDGTVLSIHSDERYVVPLDPVTNFGETALEIVKRLHRGGWQGGATDPGDFAKCLGGCVRARSRAF